MPCLLGVMAFIGSRKTEKNIETGHNWETNILALSKEDTGTLVVYYYTQQNVIDVVKAILDKTLIGSTNLINDSSTKTIDRVYFTLELRPYRLLKCWVNWLISGSILTGKEASFFQRVWSGNQRI